MTAELFVTLNDDRELVLEGDLLGNGREPLIEDVGGPTEWEFDPALEVPERVIDLAFDAFVDEIQANNNYRALAILAAVTYQRVRDER